MRRGKRWRRKEGAEAEDGDEGGGGAEDGGGEAAEEAGGAIIHIMVGHIYIKIDSDIFFMIVHLHTFYIIHSQHHRPSI